MIGLMDTLANCLPLLRYQQPPSPTPDPDPHKTTTPDPPPPNHIDRD